MPGLDSNTKLLLHCDGIDEATNFPDVSNSNHTVTTAGTAQVDTAVKKWGTGSLMVDGDSDYLSIPDSADWDICGSNSDDWTVDFWVKHTDHVGIEMYMGHMEDAENRWRLYHLHGSGLVWSFVFGGVEKNMVGGEIEDTDCHHIAMCKVGNEYGLYKDGPQVAYVTYDDTDVFSGSLYIGWVHGAYFLDGHMDEIRIQRSNYFGAAPVVGLTDTITVPPSSYAKDLSINVHDCSDLEDKMGG